MSAPTTPSSGSMEGKSFFATLFDFEFTSFLTLRFMRVIYILAVIVIGVAGLGYLIVFLATRSVGGILLGLVVVPIVTLVYLVLTRIWFEMIVLFFRIGENTQRIAATLGSGPGGGSPASSPTSAGGGWPGSTPASDDPPYPTFGGTQPPPPPTV